MSAVDRLVVVPGEGINTRLHYVMSAAGKRIKEGDVVLEGRMDESAISTIRDRLEANQGFDPARSFIPSLEELMPLNWTPPAGLRHDLVRIGFTNARTSPGCVDAEHFASTFEDEEPALAMAM